MSRIKEKLLSYRYNYALDHSKPKANNIFLKILGLVGFVCCNKISKIRWDKSPIENAALQTEELLKWVKINKCYGFVYPYDVKVIREMNVKFNPIASVTPDYGLLLENSWQDKYDKLMSSPDSKEKQYMQTCWEAIDSLRKRVVEELSVHKSKRNKELQKYFSNMLDKKVEHFDEALQRILFYNAIFWQCKYLQNGIGRLDLILNKYYEFDVRLGLLDFQKAKDMLSRFLHVLSYDTASKSACLVGDTGQVIILGGIDAFGENVDNDITKMLLEIFSDKPMPDPKLLLRVNKNTSSEIWKKAILSVLKGSGSPLFVNEEVVISRMVEFGYHKEDVYNFGVSACWEPLIIGKSLDQNNTIKNITILDSLTSTLEKYDNMNFKKLLSNLSLEIQKQIKEIDLAVSFDASPLQSLFFDGCIESGKDFSVGGAVYNYHGLLVVGLPNLVNSLLNIQEFVYNQNMCTLEDCLACIRDNFSNREDLRLLFVQNPKKFGLCDREVVDLTNQIMDTISNAVAMRTIHGTKVKVGFSSPSYIGLAEGYPASLDGRRKGEPFAVHISPISSNIDISEILNFASELRYEGNRINGNVVDFIIPASYSKNPDKLVDILKVACKKGIFELQLNVLDKKTLIDAKAHPEKYPNLIVRVWGFSAYFNDLPEEYKENIIKRAELYE